MKRIMSTIGFAVLSFSLPVSAQTTSTPTQTASEATSICGPIRTSSIATVTTTNIPGGTTGSGTLATAGSTTTMGLSADIRVNVQEAQRALIQNPANVGKLATLSDPKAICIVDLDRLAMAQNDYVLKDQIFKYRSNNAQLKSALASNPPILRTIRAQHPSFEMNDILATDFGPNGELILFVSRS
jgi:hypothetical protein